MSGPSRIRAADPLSEREIEVLELMAKGLSNKEIGRALWIGETTVKTHVSHILRKLGAADRTQAVLAAVKTGPGPSERLARRPACDALARFGYP